MKGRAALETGEANEFVVEANRKSRRQTLQVQFMRWALIVIFLSLWQTAVNREWLDPFFTPKPTGIARYIAEIATDGTLAMNLWSTVSAQAMAFSTGVVAGVLLALLFSSNPVLARVLMPIVTYLNALPRAALAPLFILYFGIGVVSKAAVGFSLVFFVLFFSTRAGLLNVNPDHLILARSLGYGQASIFRRIMLPSAMPSIFGGIRLAAVYSLLGVVVSELIASRAGIGQLIALNTNLNNLDGVFGSLVVLATLASILTGFMSALESYVLRWQD